MYVNNPLKISILSFMRYLKEKNTLIILRDMRILNVNMGTEYFGVEGFM